ncbi:MAG TPA: hypothetical protein VIZ68_02185 [Thermoplasmata archaeon]
MLFPRNAAQRRFGWVIRISWAVKVLALLLLVSFLIAYVGWG